MEIDVSELKDIIEYVRIPRNLSKEPTPYAYPTLHLEKYKCGIIVNIDDLNEIREAIQNLISNPGLCKRLGENGIMAINEIFNWNKMESRLISIYHSLF